MRHLMEAENPNQTRIQAWFNPFLSSLHSLSPTGGQGIHLRAMPYSPEMQQLGCRQETFGIQTPTATTMWKPSRCDL